MFIFRKIRRKNRDNYLDKEVKKIPIFITKTFFVYLIIFLTIMACYFTFQAKYYISKVEGPSMKPYINAGVSDYDSTASEDFVYVNKFRKAKRGDVVTIKTGEKSKNEKNETTEKVIIKRIIGVGGDKISIYQSDDGYFHVHIIYDGTDDVICLEEDYVKSYAEWRYTGWFNEAYIKEGIVYESTFYNTYFTGDYLEENIYKVDNVYFIQIPEGKYFCLGDNRSISSDSRTSGKKLFDETQIQGVAEILVKGGSNGRGWLFWKKISAIFSHYFNIICKTFVR